MKEIEPIFGHQEDSKADPEEGTHVLVQQHGRVDFVDIFHEPDKSVKIDRSMQKLLLKYSSYSKIWMWCLIDRRNLSL